MSEQDMMAYVDFVHQKAVDKLVAECEEARATAKEAQAELERWKDPILALMEKNARLRALLESALILIADHEALHRNSESSDYNRCEVERCQWCDEAAEVRAKTAALEGR